MLPKKCNHIFIITILIIISACSEESTSPTQYGKISGSVAIESLEKSPDNVPGDTLSIADLDSIKVFLNGVGSPCYTIKGEFILTRVKYGSHFLTSEVLSGIRIISDQIVVDSEHIILPDTITYPYKDDVYPDLVEASYSIPNPFTVTNMTVFKVNQEMTIDVFIYEPTGSEVRYLWHREVRPGSYSLTWDARNNQMIKCDPGLYFFVIYSDGLFCSYITTIKQ